MNKVNVYVWGNGKLAAHFISKCSFHDIIDFKGQISSYKGEDNCSFYKDVAFEPGDVVVIASTYTNDILKNIILDRRISLNNCIALRTTELSRELGVGVNNLYKIISNPAEFLNIDTKKINILRNESDFKRDCLWDCVIKPDTYAKYDYVRINTFDLVADEIYKKKISGAVAELGVFQGNFAQYINKKFPEHKLYLFDTFTGFDEEELNYEIEKGNAYKGFENNFKNTTINSVLKKMEFPDKCIIKQGLFPESLDGLEEKFVFVSIDVDFENSIYEGLKYFYPRLVKGGYIFVHDYNNIFLEGVKAAIEKFEEEYGEIIKIPMSDVGGTLIITK